MTLAQLNKGEKAIIEDLNTDLVPLKLIEMSDVFLVLVGQRKVIYTVVFFDILNRFIYQNRIDHCGLVYGEHRGWLKCSKKQQNDSCRQNAQHPEKSFISAKKCPHSNCLQMYTNPYNLPTISRAIRCG